MTLIVKGFPSGVYQLLPRLVKPAFCKSSWAACGLGFHQPMPKERSMAFWSVGIWSFMEGRSVSAICLPMVGSYGLIFRLPVSSSKFFSQSCIGMW